LLQSLKEPTAVIRTKTSADNKICGICMSHKIE